MCFGQWQSFARKGLRMNNEAIQTRDQLAAAYLLQAQALAFEISIAMDAIAANALTSFQESVAKQEMLCGVLASLANAISAKVRSSGQTLLVLSDSAVEQGIQATSESIRELNLRYAALLKHSGRSIAILASLCRFHTGQFQEVRGPRSKRQTWSCEM
jgi:hypothetical protein